MVILNFFIKMIIYPTNIIIIFAGERPESYFYEHRLTSPDSRHYAIGWDWPQSLVLGAILSSTDATSVFGIRHFQKQKTES